MNSAKVQSPLVWLLLAIILTESIFSLRLVTSLHVLLIVSSHGFSSGREVDLLLDYVSDGCGSSSLPLLLCSYHPRCHSLILFKSAPAPVCLVVDRAWRCQTSLYLWTNVSWTTYQKAVDLSFHQVTCQNNSSHDSRFLSTISDTPVCFLVWSSSNFVISMDQHNTIKHSFTQKRWTETRVYNFTAPSSVGKFFSGH